MVMVACGTPSAGALRFHLRTHETEQDHAGVPAMSRASHPPVLIEASGVAKPLVAPHVIHVIAHEGRTVSGRAAAVATILALTA